MQYTTIDENSFAYGIDARSAENQIKQGFVRDLVNADIIEGRVKKRRGYTNYAGELPLRVTQYRTINGSTDKLAFVFDGSVDLSRVETTPLLVYGRSSNITEGPFTATDAAAYFTDWTSNVRKTYLASTAGTVSAPATEHNITTDRMFVGIAEATSPVRTNLSSSELLEGDNVTYTIDINKTSKDITVGYTNGNPDPVDTFLYYNDQTSVSTINYATTFTVNSGVTSTQTINAATHQLQNYNIIYQLWQDVGTSYVKVRPNEFSVDSSSGLVSLIVTNSTSASITYRLLLSVVPAENNSDYNITQGTNTVAIPNVTSPFIFYTLYLVTGTTLTEVLPDGYAYDDDTNTWTVTFENGTSGALTARVYYLYGTVRSNEIQVVSPTGITSSITDTAPQLTVYGLSQSLIYGNEKQVNRRGWVNHIDSYRSPVKTHVVAGLGGNLFSALTTGEMPSAFASTMPTYYPRLNGRLAAATKLGPLFWETGSAPALDRGSISFAGGGTNWATVTSVSYQGSGITRYTLSTPGKAVVGTPVTVNQDYLTVKGMSHSRHNGEFEIVAVNLTATATTITIDVSNPNLTTSDYDDSGTAGLGGVFTDSFITAAASPFLPDDILLSSFWDGEANLVVKSAAATKTVVSNVYDYLSLGSGLVITGQRTSAEVPLRNVLNTPYVTYLVAGDTIFYSPLTRPLQILAVNPVTGIITLDEELTWYDSLSAPPTFTVPQRWLPAESPQPDTGDTLLPTTVVRHLTSNDYDSQPFLRSVMVQNNMYLTNGSDEVYKYDGSSFYRAGIIPWQPGLFLTTQSGVANGIPFAGISASATATGATLVISKADATQFPVGTVIKYSDTTNTAGIILTVASNTEKSASDHSLTFEEPLKIIAGGSSGVISLVYQARYSFRLNIKDRNGITVASAVTGAEDFVALLAPTTTTQYFVNLKLVGLPAWDQYDYSNKNIELKIYRTKWTTIALGEVSVFYEVATQQMPYTGTDGYLSFTDKLSNATLVNGDPVVGVLSPDTVPAGWDEPARAKYVTSAGNRLVLGNITDWPTLAVSYLTSGDVAYTSYNGQKFLFRRDSTDTATITNMVDRATYELISATGTPTSWTTPVAGTSFSFTCTPSRALVAGDWAYLYYGTSTINALDYSGWWQIETPVVHATTTVGNGTTTATVNVVSTTGFPTAGVIKINGVNYSYTGVTGTSFTGVSPTLSYSAGQAVTNTTVTVNTTLAGSVTPAVIPYVLFATAAYDIPVNIDGDYNMGMFNGDTVSFLTPANRILRRIGMAINATMRMTNKAITGQSAFVPWLMARSESDTQGQLIVKQPRAEVETPTLQIIYAANNYTAYINGSKVGAYTTTSGTGTNVTSVTVATTINFPFSGSFTLDGSGVVYTYSGTTSTTFTGISPTITYTNGQTVIPAPTPALTTRYPSRILVSYNNYPEIFDNPFTVNDDLSDSAIDINSSDGQEITGIIPFFGESAFGAALQSGVLVVFKQNSIYLVDLAEKRAGRNPVQRLETQGLGCTAPYSIAPTKDGIAFANDSGIYVLRRNQRIEYLGRFVERLWQQSVDRNYLDLVQGHHYNVGRQYKLSVPLASESLTGYAENSEVYVYNHTNEGTDETGGWGRYTNHPATGWANLFQDAFYGTVGGAVKRLRAEGIAEDYRDDDAAIEAVLTTRATDFGQAGIRKVVSHVIVNYRTGGTSENTSVEISPDLHTDFDTTTAFTIVNYPTNDGISSLAGQDIRTVRHSLTRRRCVYMTVRVSNTGLDEDLEIAGMSFVVSGLNSKGIVQAASTKK